jgi:tetratricopeptide (TPR) repeat protein
MATISENELSDSQRALYLKARHANEIRNYGYVVQLMQPVLKEAPAFLDGRKLLRAAALAVQGGKKSGFSLAGTTLGMTAGSTLKKDPLAAMELAERTLANDPTNTQGNQLLFEAANKAGFPETAAFALETLLLANPKDVKLLNQLGDHYMIMGSNEKAVAIFNRITQINPTDQDAIKKGKDAAAAATMKAGRWEEAAKSGGTMSFRDMIKQTDEAAALENKAKIVRTVEQIAQQVTEIFPQWEANQTNVDLTRRLAMLYEQWFETAFANKAADDEVEGYLDNSIWYFNHINGLQKGGDPNVLRKCADMQAKKVERRIKALETWLAQVNPNDPDAQPFIEELNQLRRHREESALEIAKKRVADNPTDLLLRYEFGEALMKAGQFSEAIPELQRARQNPAVRIKGMNLLGQCFVEKGMFDLAISQFRSAASETPNMDATKKDILYRLGLVYERMSKREDYLDCMKQIYEADYGYLDVASRVEGSYGSGKP